MRTDFEHVQPGPAQGPQPTTAELIDRLARFEGPPDQFLLNLLAVQCHLAGAEAGAILRTGGQNRPEVLCVYPPPKPGDPPPAWVAGAAELAGPVAAEGVTATRPWRSPDDLYGQAVRGQLVMIPISGETGVRGVGGFLVNPSNKTSLESIIGRLELTSRLLSLYEMRLTLQRRGQDLQRLRMAAETLAQVDRHERFAAAAMAFCNELADRWAAERVSLGFLRGRYIQLKAMSHTEKFSRKMALVQTIEAAMEECLDQDTEVCVPDPPESTCVTRATRELAGHHNSAAILSLPLRRQEKPEAVVTLERRGQEPFSDQDVQTLRLACELCTRPLLSLYRQDRWFGAKLAAQLRQGLAVLVGPRHTWAKAAAVAVAAFLAFVILARGDYKVEAPFVLEAKSQHVIPAPFDGYLAHVAVDPGDSVEAGQTVLGGLDTAELRLQLAAAKAEQVRFGKEADTAMRDGKTAEAQIAEAQAYQAAAQGKLLEYQIRQAELIAPVSGFVTQGDLKRKIGAPVQTGEVLFEVAPLDALYAELAVPEDQVAEIAVDQLGELATASYPEQRIGFAVERINPIAELADQRNVFKVRVRLDQRPPWMRPGMEGVGKITVDRRSYAWIWTRRLVNWLRMKLWI